MEFADNVTKWLHEAFGEDLSKPLSAGWRLFNKGEYSASVLSAYSELEYRFSLIPVEDTHRVVPFSLPKCASEILDSEDTRDGYFAAREFRALRNQIAHAGCIATKDEADEFLRFAERLVAGMDSRTTAK